jgi:hypothetical protein
METVIFSSFASKIKQIKLFPVMAIRSHNIHHNTCRTVKIENSSKYLVKQNKQKFVRNRQTNSFVNLARVLKAMKGLDVEEVTRLFSEVPKSIEELFEAIRLVVTNDQKLAETKREELNQLVKDSETRFKRMKLGLIKGKMFEDSFNVLFNLIS